MSDARDDEPSKSRPGGAPSRRSLPPFEALRAFDAVARLRGIRKAAISLDRDHAVISRHLRTLESWTGAKLVERTATGIVLTEPGLRYHRQVAAAIDAIVYATIDLVRQGTHSRLNLWSMPGFALHWLTRRLGGFEAKHPSIEIELRPTDTSPDFLAHEADIDIRFVAAYGEPFKLPPGLRALEFAHSPIVGVASPEFIAQAGPIDRPSDLVSLRLLHEDNFDSWSEWLAAHGVFDDLDLSGPRLWQGQLTLEAARYGRGIALANYLVAADDLKSGRLVEVGKGNPNFHPHTMGIYLFITRADRWDEPCTRKFRSWLMDTIRAELPEMIPASTAAKDARTDS